MSVLNSWTPVARYATVGTSTWAASTQTGFIHIADGKCTVWFNYVGVPTNGTGAGDLQITGLPVPNGAFIVSRGGGNWGGITPVAAFTEIKSSLTTSSNIINFFGSGSGLAPAAIVVADVPSGGTVNLKYEFSFLM